MLRLILVPLDGSAFGELALPLALSIAERQRAELELVHVFEETPPSLVQGAPALDPGLDRDLKRDRESYLQSVAGWVRRSTAIPVTATLLEGTDVASVLAEHIARRHADLVAMTTHGRSGISRLWMGSVAIDVVRHSASPVLVIRPAESGSRDEPARPFRRVLVPLDGSPADDDAVDDLLAVAGADDAEFTLLHVIVPVVYLTEPPQVAVLTEVELETAAERYLEETARKLRPRGFAVTTRVVTHTQPARAILEYATEWGAGLVAMEAHTRTALERLLLGSTTDKVIRASHVPVLVHRPRVDADESASPASAGARTTTSSRPRAE
jgi:nucleotide-binding universal stress UspA family protein